LPLRLLQKANNFGEKEMSPGMGEDRYQPACMATHRLVNQLSAIIGHCDLLIETEQGPERAKGLTIIREIANMAVKELIAHQRQLEAEARKRNGRISADSPSNNGVDTEE
jgi:hypothetical protein